MLKLNFYEINSMDNDKLKFAVIMSNYKGKWVFVKHKLRSTWEIPGGRRKLGENISDTASRELVEETGAKDFKIIPISIYSVDNGENESFGQLFYSEINTLGKLLQHEVGEVKLYDKIPENLTYPLIQPHLYKKVEDYVKIKEASAALEHLDLGLKSSNNKVQQLKDSTIPDKVYDVYKICSGKNVEYILKLDSNGYESKIYKDVFDNKILPVPLYIDSVKVGSEHWMLISHVGDRNIMGADIEQYLMAARSLATIHSQLAREILVKHNFLRDKTNKIDMILNYLEDNINLPAEIVNKIKRAGERLQRGPMTLIHDDLLPINVMLNNKEVFFIDWKMASYGCYAHDLGRLLGDIRDENERYWVDQSWRMPILKAYYEELHLENKPDWTGFILDFKCACILNYAEIVIAHLKNDWEHSPWYHANVRAIVEYEPIV